ncbi:MAG: hypothetical protein L6R28_11755 [Planctomycetes bacterium]|nr:hypothetical protein [Planctomycetota bacterium]
MTPAYPAAQRMTRLHLFRIACLLLLFGSGAAQHAADAAPAAPAFAQEPSVRRDGSGWRIDFAVAAPTDVTIYIQDAEGRIVRHLVSGVLGENPPAPLVPGLKQSVPWDGKADLDRDAGAGPFTARVCLGMKVDYDGEVLSDRLSLTRLRALAAGPDGTLYIVTRIGTSGPNWKGHRLIALNRDGTYQRTVLPPPAGLGREQWKNLGARTITLDGREAPVFLELQTRQLTGLDFAGGYYNGTDAGPGIALTPGGYALTLQNDGSMAMVALDPHKQDLPLNAPKLLPDLKLSSFLTNERSFVAVSGDGVYAYFTGIAPSRLYSSKPAQKIPAVYRVKLPERSPAEVFYGNPAKAGDDDGEVSADVGSLAADGRGTLFVTDPAHDRILALDEASRKCLGRLKVEKPQKIAVDRTSGALYVLGNPGHRNHKVELLKFNSWKDPKPAAKIELNGLVRTSAAHWDLAVDGSAQPPVLWATDNYLLLRIEDQGAAFSKPARIGNSSMGDASFVDVSVDRFREPNEVYIRSRFYAWTRINEATGAQETVSLAIPSNGGSCLQAGPDGHLYTPAWPCYLLKWDRNGKRVPWGQPFEKPPGSEKHHVLARKDPISNAIFARVAMIYMTHTHGIRYDGQHFIFEGQGRVAKALNEIDPGGKRVGQPVIWNATDNAIGPRFDPQGNIYVADVVRPLDRMVPPELAELAGELKPGGRISGPASEAIRSYGSILKFSPKGGAIEFPGVAGVAKSMMEPKPYEGEMKLDPSLKAVEMAASTRDLAIVSAKVTGAQWAHFGISHVELTQCNCENTRFDVDWFGRVWYPDLACYRVGVLDTNGNPIARFGGYGNADSMGPESKDERLAEPGLAFTWLIGVAASDRHVYMGDSMNQRLLRGRIAYAKEAACAVK